jgi:hypothetical protein
MGIIFVVIFPNVYTKLCEWFKAVALYRKRYWIF